MFYKLWLKYKNYIGHVIIYKIIIKICIYIIVNNYEL